MGAGHSIGGIGLLNGVGYSAGCAVPTGNESESTSALDGKSAVHKTDVIDMSMYDATIIQLNLVGLWAT